MWKLSGEMKLNKKQKHSQMNVLKRECIIDWYDLRF